MEQWMLSVLFSIQSERAGPMQIMSFFLTLSLPLRRHVTSSMGEVFPICEKDVIIITSCPNSDGSCSMLRTGQILENERFWLSVKLILLGSNYRHQQHALFGRQRVEEKKVMNI